MTGGTLHVALVGLRFGAAFAPIYRDHGLVGRVTLCDADPAVAREVGARFGLDSLRPSLDAVLEDPSVDAVHLVTPIPQHEEQCVRTLRAGKHCACTVPMATTPEGCRRVAEAARRSGKHYMMMETAVYTRNFLYARELLERGAFGRIQLLRGAHYQDMEYWPPYWRGLPPMHYATHALSPLLALSGRRVRRVVCFGSGRMREELRAAYGNPYPIETALFDLGDGLAAEVTRSLFHTARQYTESFSVYGEHASFEWQQLEDEAPALFRMFDRPSPADNGARLRGRETTAERRAAPDYAGRLPEEIRRYTVRSRYFDETNPQLSFEAGGGHGGAHPHLVHEFVSSIAQGRRAAIDEQKAAEWTLPGLYAHQSALAGGREIALDAF